MPPSKRTNLYRSLSVFSAFPGTPALQRRCAEIYVAHTLPSSAKPLWHGEAYRHERIRIGYFSADFHEHATAYLMARLFELHDHTRFEVFAFSFGPDRHDEMRSRLENAFEHFLDVRALSDIEIATQARALEIDIAVDLKGHTTDSRTGNFCLPAGAVADQLPWLPRQHGGGVHRLSGCRSGCDPCRRRTPLLRKIVRLPYCYQVNDSQRQIAPHTPTRTTLRLPEDGFVFCCFNNNYKITPDVFTIWMHLLTQAPGSVLWLLEDNPAGEREICALGTSVRSPGRPADLCATATGLTEHLARQRQADLFLDTFHYNAHTTASDALWAGLPLLTFAGPTFPARVAASLLTAIGLPQLITHSPQEYADLALELAQDPQRLKTLRSTLAEQISLSPLFDSMRFTRHLETAFETVHARHQSGLPPASFSVGA